MLLEATLASVGLDWQSAVGDPSRQNVVAVLFLGMQGLIERQRGIYTRMAETETQDFSNVIGNDLSRCAALQRP